MKIEVAVDFVGNAGFGRMKGAVRPRRKCITNGESFFLPLK